MSCIHGNGSHRACQLAWHGGRQGRATGVEGNEGSCAGGARSEARRASAPPRRTGSLGSPVVPWGRLHADEGVASSTHGLGEHEVHRPVKPRSGSLDGPGLEQHVRTGVSALRQRCLRPVAGRPGTRRRARGPAASPSRPVSRVGDDKDEPPSPPSRRLRAIRRNSAWTSPRLGLGFDGAAGQWRRGSPTASQARLSPTSGSGTWSRQAQPGPGVVAGHGGRRRWPASRSRPARVEGRGSPTASDRMSNSAGTARSFRVPPPMP